MENIIKGIMCISLKEIKQKYPNGFDYLLSKKGTSIVINGFYVELICNRTGYKLIYDQDDIKYFDMLVKSENIQTDDGKAK
jgi:hypothetical protein